MIMKNVISLEKQRLDGPEQFNAMYKKSFVDNVNNDFEVEEIVYIDEDN